jgi:polyisoprenoid-binding protein YceI
MARQLSVLRTRDDREIPAAGEYTIDPTHTTVEFVGRHLMIAKVRGRFPGVSGTITIATNAPACAAAASCWI